MRQKRDIQIRQGNTFREGYQFYTENAAGATIPLPLDGSRLVLIVAWKASQGMPAGEIRRVWPDGDLVVSPVSEEGGADVVEFHLSPADTRLVPVGNARWELEWQREGDEQTLIYGVDRVSKWINDDA